MKDIELCRILNIQNSTLADWKKRNNSDDWRYLIYKYLSIKPKAEFASEIERVKKLIALEQEQECKI